MVVLIRKAKRPAAASLATAAFGRFLAQFLRDFDRDAHETKFACQIVIRSLSV
jgi:hypothetical protein